MKYREQLFPVLVEVGLNPRYPVASNNYVFMPYLSPLVHVGISVIRGGLRVTLNLRRDLDRSRFNALLQERDAIDAAIGQSLDWDDEREERQKSVVRAARDGGYVSEERGWPVQQRWAADTARRFTDEFTPRLS